MRRRLRRHAVHRRHPTSVPARQAIPNTGAYISTVPRTTPQRQGPGIGARGSAGAASEMAASELGQLGERPHDPHLTRAEADNQGGVILHEDDPAQAVPVVRHLVVHGELLNRGIRGHGVEGTTGQEASGRGAGRLHYHQYAPFRRPAACFSMTTVPGIPGAGRPTVHSAPERTGIPGSRTVPAAPQEAGLSRGSVLPSLRRWSSMMEATCRTHTSNASGSSAYIPRSLFMNTVMCRTVSSGSPSTLMNFPPPAWAKPGIVPGLMP